VDSFEISAWFDADPTTVFGAWTDPHQHAAFTGGGATGAAVPGQAFTAWDGYITGIWLRIDPDQGFAQSWRTSEFADGDADALLEITMRRDGRGTELTLRHSNLPAGEGDRYRQGWVDHYFDPLTDWLANGRPSGPTESNGRQA